MGIGMIIGTAGHIDHGKSALVEALTGRRMDPLEEERRRGITIDLHFAELPLADGRSAGVVDVPGHEDLIRTMVAGAGGLDVVLLVIAADDGIMPQTREHLAIIEQLRVSAGLPVITKADTVEPEWLEMVTAEVTEWLAASPVRFGRAVATSVRTGAGVAELRAAIEAQAATAETVRPVDDLFRLPIDRAFSLAGAGTVVTGTAWSGVLSTGDLVRVLPGGQEGRVRSIERHGRTVARSTPGDRTAVAVTGLDRHTLRRGDVLVRAGDPWETATALDVLLEILPSAPRPLTTNTRIRVHHGTLEALARVQLRDPIPPGATGLARLALEAPIVARGRDRLVIRSYSPLTTIGGGEILDPLPPRSRSNWPAGMADGDLARRLAALVARRPAGLPLSQAPVVLGVPAGKVPELCSDPALCLISGTLFPAAAVESLSRDLIELVREFQRDHPSEAGIPLETLRGGRGAVADAAIERLQKLGEVVIEHGLARELGFQPEFIGGGGAELDRLVELIEAARLAPPTTLALETEFGIRTAAAVLRLAAREGRLVAVERDRYYGTRALAEFRALLAGLAERGPFTPADVRNATGLSRKFLIPLLEWADREGLTVRRGEARLGGPALGRQRPAG